MQPYEARKLIGCFDFNSPEPPATLINQLAATVCYAMTLFFCENTWKITHGLSIRTHKRKGWIVGILPLTQ